MIELFKQLYLEILFIIDNLFSNQVAFTLSGSKTILIIFALVFLLINLFLKLKKKDRSYEYVVFKLFWFIYILMVIKYVFLPIPFNGLAVSNMREMAGPFTIESTYLMSIIPILGIFYSHSLISFLLNIILFIPYGIFSKLLENSKSYKSIVIRGFFISLLIEITQLSLNVLWNANYRSFDFNDMIANTLGTAFGVLIYLIMNNLYSKNMKVN